MPAIPDTEEVETSDQKFEVITGCKVSLRPK